MVIVDSIPADLRPYIGGSSDGTVLDLVLGYNGLGRILGRNASTVLGVASAGQGANFGGAAGWARLFGAQVGGQISWLLPLSAIALVAGLLSRLGQPRTDGRRAWYVLWGGWLATHFVVFSLAEGTFHPYYTTALAPAIAALCGPGLVALWGLYRRSWWTAWLLPASIGMTAAWSYALLSRSAWLPWLKLVVVGAAVVAIVGLLVARLIHTRSGRMLARAAVVIGLVAMLAGPAAWSTTPLTSAVNGTNPAAGPADASLGGFGGGPGGAPNGGGFGAGQGRTGQFGTGAPSQGAGTRSRGATTQPADGGAQSQTSDSQVPSFDGQPQAVGGVAPGGADGGMPGGFGGPGGQASTELMNYLVANRGDAAFLVAVSGANSAAPIILATHQPVLAMGGFTGSDPAPTLAQLQAMVASGELRFILLGGGGGPGRSSSDIQQWVQATGTLVDASTYGGSSNQQLYDLSSAVAALS
jgi:4-amino-4-deoxy-L-arabinose transferase-like glycosyltransferase